MKSTSTQAEIWLKQGSPSESVRTPPTLIIAFRGTSDIKNVRTDIDAFKQEQVDCDGMSEIILDRDDCDIFGSC